MATFEDLTRWVYRAATRLPTSVEDATRQLTDDLRDRVIQNASGRPGPEIITGDYVGSIKSKVTRDGGEVTGQVSTDRPQAMRLEHGFSGMDSLGRVYNQPPFPHWRPAQEWAQDRTRRAIGKAVEVVVGP